ncbi:MAG: glycosyltransferase family 2 protein [Verrucomicrobiota bacterium]
MQKPWTSRLRRAIGKLFHRRRYKYAEWFDRFETLSENDRRQIHERITRLPLRPRISILLPVYNIDDRWLRLALDSVLNQLYPDWELCVVDDCSPRPHVRATLAEYQQKDARIKVRLRERNGHISESTNDALAMATGEFVAFFDHDDELTEHALYFVAEEINQHPDVDLLYSDQDRIGPDGELSFPMFKPGWSPDLLHSQNYVSHLSVFRTSLVRGLGGLRKGFEGSQDYDLVLRFSEQTRPERIRHIPRVLYHWRAIPGSVALGGDQKNYAHENARRALQEHFSRTGRQVEVAEGFRGYHRILHPLPTPAPLVSLIIGTRDRVNLLRGIVDGILQETDYPNFEVIIVDNQSSEPATLRYFDELRTDSRVRIVKYDAPFNFSAINNFGVQASRGEVVGLLNNDLKVISPGWLTELVRQAIRPEVGAVGAKLYYANDTIQHAGVVLGIGPVAGHSHKYRPRKEFGFMARLNVVGNYSAVTAACLFVRRSVFDEAGGLDEKNLAVAFNDVDLCLKIQARGYWNVFTPYAELYHLESASRGPDTAPEAAPRFQREVQFMVSKWGERLKHDPCYNPNLSNLAENFDYACPPRTCKPWLP